MAPCPRGSRTAARLTGAVLTRLGELLSPTAGLLGKPLPFSDGEQEYKTDAGETLAAPASDATLGFLSLLATGTPLPRIRSASPFQETRRILRSSTDLSRGMPLGCAPCPGTTTRLSASGAFCLRQPDLCSAGTRWSLSPPTQREKQPLEDRGFLFLLREAKVVSLGSAPSGIVTETHFAWRGVLGRGSAPEMCVFSRPRISALPHCLQRTTEVISRHRNCSTGTLNIFFFKTVHQRSKARLLCRQAPPPFPGGIWAKRNQFLYKPVVNKDFLLGWNLRNLRNRPASAPPPHTHSFSGLWKNKPHSLFFRGRVCVQTRTLDYEIIRVGTVRTRLFFLFLFVKTFFPLDIYWL